MRFSPFLAAAVLAITVSQAPLPSFAAEHVLVPMDEARVVRLNRSPNTVVVGNPLVVSVSVQNENMLILVGKTFGTTNVIALDQDGKELSNLDISVRHSGNGSVQVYKAGARTSYTCNPRCERRLEMGDDNAGFEALLKQQADKVNLSEGATPE